MSDTVNLDEKFFSYKGKPLVKNKNTIYYGSMMDEYVVMLQILSEKEEGGETVPNNILVQLMKTDTTLNPVEIVVKKSEKEGLYNALEIAEIWLTRALTE